MLAGRYELRTHLGGGAVGQVWAAQDTRFDRPVAVKIVRIAESQNVDSDQVLARFERECLATGRLNHPNVARAYDAGRDGDNLYLVTELIDGESVADLLAGRTSPLPIDAALELAEQVCAGLAAAHDAGIVHRDLKPANVMVGDDAVVKIIDFGIARFAETNLPQLTRPGMMVGTLAYAPPEQLSGGAADARSDLYGLGCMMYELIAGRRPFTDPTVEGLIWQHLHDDPAPLEQVRPQTPPMLARLVADMMRKNPADRPPDARTVQARIQACLAALPVPVPVDYDPTDPVDPSGGVAGVPAQVGVGSSPDVRPATPPLPAQGGPEDHETVKVSGTPARAGTLFMNPSEVMGLGLGGPPADAPPGIPAGPDAWEGRTYRTNDRRREGRSRFARPIVLVPIAVALVAVVVLVFVVLGSSSKPPKPKPAPFTVTSVAASVPTHPCSLTVTVVGTINTNGQAGTITYQWVRSDGAKEPQQTVTAVAGTTSVQVKLRWEFSVLGGGVKGTATLKVLTPVAKSASTPVGVVPCG